RESPRPDRRKLRWLRARQAALAGSGAEEEWAHDPIRRSRTPGIRDVLFARRLSRAVAGYGTARDPTARRGQSSELPERHAQIHRGCDGSRGRLESPRARLRSSVLVSTERPGAPLSYDFRATT